MPYLCSVCHDEMLFSGHSTRPICTTPCGHVYHEECLIPMFAGLRAATKKPCPICRHAFKNAEISRLFIDFQPSADESNAADEQKRIRADLVDLKSKCASVAAAQKRALLKTARSTAEFEKAITAITVKLDNADERLEEVTDKLIAARAEKRTVTTEFESAFKEKDDTIKQLEQAKTESATKIADLEDKSQQKTDENRMLRQSLDNAKADRVFAINEAREAKSKSAKNLDLESQLQQYISKAAALQQSLDTARADVAAKDAAHNVDEWVLAMKIDKLTAELESVTNNLAVKEKQYRTLYCMYTNEQREKKDLQMKLGEAADGQSKMRMSLVRIRELTDEELPAKRTRGEQTDGFESG